MSIFAARRGIIASSYRPPPFPMTLPGLEHWCDFSALGLPDNTPIAEAGQVGPKWSRPTAGARPTYRTGANGINGLGALVFDGDDSMVFAATSGIRLFCAVGLEFTVALVGEFPPPPLGRSVLLSRAPNSSAALQFGLFRGSDGNISINLRASGDQVLVANENISAGPHLIVVTWDGTQARGYFDGGAAVTLSVGTAGEQTNNLITLGALNNGAAHIATAGTKFGETIFLSTALEGGNASYRTALVSYAMTKWGIS